MKKVMLLLVLTTIGCTRVGGSVGGTGPPPHKVTDPWPTTAAEIGRSPDTITARRVLGQLNADLNAVNESLPAISTDDYAKFMAKLRPSAEESKDWSASSFTPMDGVYLGECLFFRSVSRSLDLDGLPVEKQAAAAFDWVCRQMYLRPWLLDTPNGPIPMPPLPPQEALKRGYGTGIEREYAFLALARQLRLDAAIIGPPGGEAKRRWEIKPDRTQSRGPFWAVGVRDGNDWLLFDPWLGEVVPFKLSAAKASPTDVAKWIDDRKSAYGLKWEDVAASVPVFTVPMNAVTPRMKKLEAQLAAESGVKLSASLPTDQLWHGPSLETDPFCASRVLGQFTPKDEGGWDARPHRNEQLSFLAARFGALAPGLFSPPPELTEALAGEEFRNQCQSAYHAVLGETGFRDKMQRGQFNEVVRQLVELERTFTTIRNAVRNDAKLAAALAEWYASATEAYGRLRRSRLPENADQRQSAEAGVRALWGNNQPIHAMVNGAVAEVGLGEVAYLLALAKHEQAERSQLRLAKNPASTAKAAGDWAAAQAAWARCTDSAAKFDTSYPGRAAHVARLAARAAKSGAP